MSLVLLGLSGRAGAGKDTIADYLIKDHGWSGKMSYARNLKDMIKHVFKLSEYQLMDHKGKKQPINISLTPAHIGGVLTWMCRTHEASGLAGRTAEIKKFIADVKGKKFSTPREVIQFVGTDLCRMVIPTYHVDIIKQKLDKATGSWIITDVRFPNEADLVKDKGGYLIKVERPGLETTDVHRHSSETALQDWDSWHSTIINDSSNIEDLYTKVDKFLIEGNLCRKTTQ